jgi:small multidrug resistance family-3 protein
VFSQIVVDGRAFEQPGAMMSKYLLVSDKYWLGVGGLVLAGCCELFGAYMFWKALRAHESGWLILAGVASLTLYAVIQTIQPGNFGRVYAAYGGIFIMLSILWEYRVEHVRPDKFDIIGGLLAVAGACIIKFWPRG